MTPDALRGGRTRLRPIAIVVLAAGLTVTAGGPGALAEAPEVRTDESEANFWVQALHPYRARYRALVREAALRRGSPAEARALLEEAVRLEPGEPEGHYWLGRVDHAERRWGECASELGKALALMPSFRPVGEPTPLGDLGLCLALAGRLDESAVVLERALSLGAAGGVSPQVLHFNLGDSFQALGRLEDAIAEYGRAIELAPQEAEPHFALAVAYDRDGQVARAVDTMREALRLDPSPDQVELGKVLFVPPEDEDFYRGFASQIAGRRLRAIVHFRRYLDRAPTNPWARRARDHLAQLGPSALGTDDVQFFFGRGTVDRRAIVAAIAAAAPRLVECLGGERAARALVKITLHPAAARPGQGRGGARQVDRRAAEGSFAGAGAAPEAGVPAVWVVSDGPVALSQEAVSCVADRARGIVFPRVAGSLLGITFDVIAP